MADSNDLPESEAGPRLKSWQGRLIGGLLIVAGALHAFKPSWLTLDWPSIALILAGVLLFIVQLEDVGSAVESLEFGKTKILFRKVRQLDETVNKAVSAEILRMPETHAAEDGGTIRPSGGVTHDFTGIFGPAAGPGGAQDTLAASNSESSPTRGAARTHDDQHMQILLQTDKQMALIRIGIEIERALTRLINRGTLNRAILWSDAIKRLESRGVITPEVARAIIEFRNVRNQIIHPSGGPVPDGVVLSALDSGLKLLDILTDLEVLGIDETQP